MPSIAELQNRVDELSSAIERQKQILMGLENSRSHAIRDLNIARDPMARLPLEISSDIFMRCLPAGSRYPQPSPHNAPLLFLRICRVWSEVALATPTLWVAVRFDFLADCSDVYDSNNRFERWLSRAGGYHLDLSLGGDLGGNVDTIQKHAPQIQALDLRVQSFEDIKLGRILSFSALLELNISNIGPTTLLSDCIEIFRNAPLLVDCEFKFVYWDDDIGSSADSQLLLHTSLRHLRLGKLEGITSGSDILRYLTLPALESLVISDFLMSDIDFASFLTRSSPPLRSLHIAAKLNLEESDKYLRLMPGVEELTVQCSNPYPFSLFSRTAIFLPNLRHLTVLERFPLHYYDKQTRWPTYHIQLASLRIILPQSRSTQRPNDSILAAFRQYKEDGMDVHLGPKSTNYV